MKKLLLVGSLFLLALVVALAPLHGADAANEVTFPQEVTWSVGSVSITVRVGSQVDSFTVGASSVDATLSGGGLLKLNTPNRTTYGRSGESFSACGEFTIDGTTGSTQTWTITPSSTSCGGGGGGGGGGAPAPAPSQPVPVVTVPLQAPVTSSYTTEANILAGTAAAVQIPATFKKIVENAYGAGASQTVKNQIAAFVVQGTPTTMRLGEGERAAVVRSFAAALGKAPSTALDWEDVVKIGNGRWPTQRSVTKEQKAEATFKTIYRRSAIRTNKYDDAAVTVMAYGLRPSNRNLKSEAAALKTFRAVFKRMPRDITDWDMNRAIAYSGAKR